MMEREEKKNRDLPEGWDLRAIESLGEVVTGSTPRTNNPDFWDGEYLFITPSDITDSLFLKSTERKVTSFGLNMGRYIPEGTVLVTCIGSIGKMAISNVKIAITNQQINSIVCNNTCNNYFVYYLLKAFKDVLSENASQTTLPIINKSNFLKLKLPFPQIHEQKKIAAILYKIQMAIEAQDEIIKKTKELKKSTMQFLFTRGIYGEKTKQTEIGEMPEGWKTEPFVDTLDDFKAERTKQIQANAYLLNGKYPIVDQGQGLIAGWSNDESAVIKDGLPLIIFGDHTRVFKYVDFPFAIGADGTKLIKPQSRFDTRYFYYYFLSLDIPSKGYSRHYKILKENCVNYPSLPEQKKIASILYNIDQKMELAEKKKQTLNNLFQSMLNKLMTGEIRV